jgi:hypothetical protein
VLRSPSRSNLSSVISLPLATDFAALFGSGLLSTYLLLFVEFFIKTYSSAKKNIVRHVRSLSGEIPADAKPPRSTPKKDGELLVSSSSSNGTAVDGSLTPRRSARRAVSQSRD